MYHAPAASYDGAVTIPAELRRARHLAHAADETAARDLLLSLMAPIERADRDDWMLDVFAQLGEIYLVRGAHDGVREAIRRIHDTLDHYDPRMPEFAAMSECYRRRELFLECGLAAAGGDHDGAAALLAALATDLAAEHRWLLISARIHAATALCDDDLHVRSVPLWQDVTRDLAAGVSADPECADHLLVAGALGYGRFCVETGRLAEAEPWLRRAGARAQQRGWELATARAQLERAAASWSAGDHVTTGRLVDEAYPAISAHARAHDVARCWLYRGLIGIAMGALQHADECWGHAERHWRELGKPLYIHRILLQRSWIPIFFGRYPEAVELIAQARAALDSAPRSSWLQYARLDDQLGTVHRAQALGDLGFDAAGDPSDSWEELEDRHVRSLGLIDEEAGTPRYRRAMAALERAAELKLPAALAVDSVRYSIADAAARTRWGASVSAPMLAGAFAVAYEWENAALLAEMIEYHSARGAFTPMQRQQSADWTSTATPQVPLTDEPALAAAGHHAGTPSLTPLRPLPALQMDPGAPPVLAHYRQLARQRYGRVVTADGEPWRTWP